MYEKADAHSQVLFLHSSVHGAEMNKSILTEAVGQCVLLFKTNKQTKKLHVCLQTVRDSGAQNVKSLFRNKKELCGIGLELPARDATRLTEVCHTNAPVKLSHV